MSNSRERNISKLHDLYDYLPAADREQWGAGKVIKKTNHQLDHSTPKRASLKRKAMDSAQPKVSRNKKNEPAEFKQSTGIEKGCSAEKKARINVAINYLKQNQHFFLFAIGPEMAVWVESLAEPSQRLLEEGSKKLLAALETTEWQSRELLRGRLKFAANPHPTYADSHSQELMLEVYKKALKTLSTKESNMRALLSENESFLDEVLAIEEGADLNLVIDDFYPIRKREREQERERNQEQELQPLEQLVDWIKQEAATIPDSYQKTHQHILFSRNKNQGQASALFKDLNLCMQRYNGPQLKLIKAIEFLNLMLAKLIRKQYKKHSSAKLELADYVSFNDQIKDGKHGYRLMVAYLLRAIYDQLQEIKKLSVQDDSVLGKMLPKAEAVISPYVGYISINDVYKKKYNLESFQAYQTSLVEQDVSNDVQMHPLTGRY